MCPVKTWSKKFVASWRELTIGNWNNVNVLIDYITILMLYRYIYEYI